MVSGLASWIFAHKECHEIHLINHFLDSVGPKLEHTGPGTFVPNHQTFLTKAHIQDQKLPLIDKNAINFCL
jgi:hypothetical protein